MHIRGLLACALFAALSGCDIEYNEGGDSDGVSLCSSFCDRLVLCGSLEESRVGACTSQCTGSYKASAGAGDKKRHHDDDEDDAPNATEQGCMCVLQDECRPVDEYRCPGAPLPPPQGGPGGSSSGTSGTGGTAGKGGTAGAGGTSGTAGAAGAGAAGSAGSAGACSVNHDCGTGEDCVEGQCRARCKASCQCAEGEACVEGYCGAPEVPAVSCASDCDCTAGQSCVNNACK
ncbi:MAG: hypothetical protein MUF64_14430 [Polyangiaceae bacterium]|nr:hypothetical protein [Polyangiaceae bacterium]